MLASIFLVGIFFIMGYVARLVRNVIAGEQYPLPEWDDLGDYFTEGFKLFAVSLIWFIPVIIFAVVLGLPAIIMSAAENEGLRNVGGGMLGCAWCFLFPLGFAISFFLPAALLMVVTTRRFGAGFEFARIWAFIRANIGNYLLAIVVYLVARFIAGFGIALLCVGVLFTEFWGMVVTGFAFAQVWRLAKHDVR